jgi:hypothetical protein
MEDASRATGAARAVISNPIHVGVSAPARTETPELRDPAAVHLSLFNARDTAGWTPENDSASLSAIEAVQMISGMELRLRYGLAGGSPVGQYAGAAVETAHGVHDYDRVGFSIRAEHPMRLSIQVRAEVPNAPPECVMSATGHASQSCWRRSRIASSG